MLDHHRFTVDNDILLRDLGDILNHRVLFRFLDRDIFQRQMHLLVLPI